MKFLNLNYKKHLILLLMFLNFSIVFSQNNSANNSFKPRVNNLPSSPEAALLGKFGDIPIGYYTGTANISIPLYSIDISDIQIPIELKYHSSGIKVTEEATWVGLGWDLSPGGNIIQEIRGKEDHLDNNLGFLNNNYEYNLFKADRGPIASGLFYSSHQTGINHMYQCDGSPMVSDGDSFNIIEALIQGEGEPDIYHYSFGNFSGKFYINPETHQIKLMDSKEDIYFEGGINGWTATTLDGNKYFFETIETSTGLVLTEYKGRTFKLSRIDCTNGESVFFTYVDEKYTGHIRNESYVINPSPTLFEPIHMVSDESTIHYKKTLSSITTPNSIIDFILEDREDINTQVTDNVKRLKKIDIKSRINNKKVKTFEFLYSYFSCDTYIGSNPANYSALYQNALCKRLKLNHLKEIGYNIDDTPDVSKPPYQFEYNESITMPLKNSKSIDIYGYFNGKHNTGLLPDLDYFDYHNQTSYNNTTPITPFIYGTYNKNNRFSDKNYVSAYILNKIVYPTGGYTLFEYESNSFTNQFIPDNINLDIAYKNKLVSDTNIPGNISSVSFQLSKTTTIRFENKIHNGFTPYNSTSFTPYTYQQMMGSFIKLSKVIIINGNPVTTILKTWDLTSVLNVDFTNNNGKLWVEDYKIEYDSNPSVYYTVSVNLPNNLTNNSFNAVEVKSRFYYYDNIGLDTSLSFGNGIRIKSIKNYSNENVLSTYKVLNYFGGKLLHKFDPLSIIPTNYTYCIPTGYISFNVSNSCLNRITISSDDFGLINDNLLGYDSVEEVDYDSNFNTIGRIKNYYFNTLNQGRKGSPASINQKNGLLLKEHFFDKNLNIVSEKEYSYGNLFSFTSFSGIKIKNHIIGSSDFPNNSLCFPNLISKFSYDLYPLISERIKLLGIATKEYFNNNLIKSISYTYNSQGKVTLETSTNSENETIHKYYYYPQVNTYGNPANNEMVGRRMTGIPIRIEEWNNSSLIQINKENYNVYGNLVLPQHVFSQKGNSNLEKKIINYNNYDNGNLIEYNYEDSFPISIIWGYNKTLPVAKIENASYTSIQSSLITAIQNASNTGTEIELLNALNVLRSSLPNAMVTTYTYKPLVGVSSITDPKGDKITYHYDSFGRLEYVKDKSGNKLSENEYHYRPQN